MIEIKNKRMILFREDRLIGAKGDVDTSQRRFILDAMQGEYDLREMVAWIKIDPKFPGESPYDQAIKKEIVGDKIVLTWQFTAKNLQRAGEISAQIIFASPAYFIEDELEGILGSSPFLPSTIEGISAPVWQSYPETFVIEESIDDTVGYKEVTKNVLVSAVAEALSSAERAESAAESAQETLLNAQEAAQNARMSEYSAQMSAEAALRSEEAAASICDDIEIKRETVESNYNEIVECKQAILENLETSTECVQLVDGMYHQTYNCMESAQQSSEKAEQSAQSIISAIKKGHDFRLIYTKTLTSEDTDCYSFEITQDADGNPFSLSEFTMFMYFPMMSDSGTNYVKVGILPDDSSITKYQNLAQYGVLSKTKDTYIRSEHKNMGRWVTKMINANAWNQNAETLQINGSVASAAQSTDGKSAIAIRLSQHAGVGVPFPEGTMIEIWGVDSMKEAE